jgi:threonine/homoserine/homoserine lactone efflux protein
VIMEALQVFVLAFIFSFLGSIPPGTLNITILQLGLNHQLKLAWRFALAAALIEYPYAWIAVTFEQFITSSPAIISNFKLITACVMVILGLFSLWSAKRPNGFTKKFESSGFRRGIVLSILNPMAMPFWIVMTAFLKSQHWIDLSGNVRLHCYLAGVSLGALALLILLAFLAKKMVVFFQPSSWVKLLPSFVLIALGVYAFIQFLF